MPSDFAAFIPVSRAIVRTPHAKYLRVHIHPTVADANVTLEICMSPARRGVYVGYFRRHCPSVHPSTSPKSPTLMIVRFLTCVFLWRCRMFYRRLSPPNSRLLKLYIKLTFPDQRKPAPFERYVTRKLENGPPREE